jgi:hypothetical protein
MKTALLILILCLAPSALLLSQTAVPPDSGDGSAGNPYQIANLENLYWIAANGIWTGYFIQTSDIDASETAAWDSSRGWPGITYFGGIYDGQGHSIHHLTLNRPSLNYTGLFGQVYSGGIIRRLAVRDVSVSGNLCVGGLVGVNSGLVELCSSTGNVQGQLYYIGGLIGSNYGVTRKCWSHANANGQQCVGSLTGETYNGAVIENSYATGIASGSSAIGCLTGSCYLGYATHCYSTGHGDGGGLTGFGGTSTGCFWDTLVSGNLSSSCGTARSTAEMKMQTTYTDSGWDFDSTWMMVGNNYPILRDNPDSSQMLGIAPAQLFPATFSLHQNTPNPFNPSTRISFDLPAEAHVTLRVFNALGMAVATLMDDRLPAGTHQAVFDARNMPSGVYFYRLTSEKSTMVRRMLLIK